jgi:hypothetical protein
VAAALWPLFVPLLAIILLLWGVMLVLSALKLVE